MPTPSAVLFDLDGTLVQTREASWALFRETNRAFDLGIETQDAYFALLEDNLFVSLRTLCRNERKAEEAARHFLALLQTAYFPPLVPGMSDVVRALASACSLAVTSSNSTAAIRRILCDAQIAHCFSHVFGGDVEPDKRTSVRRFLTDACYAIGRSCRPDYREDSRPGLPTGEDVVLITDTVGDVKHARECGIRSVGVAWGMHSEAKLLAAGVEIVALWPQEIIAHLLPGGFAAVTGACAIDRDPSHMSCSCGSSCDGGTTPERAASDIRRARTAAAGSALAAATNPAKSQAAIRSADDRGTAADIGLRSGGPGSASPPAADASLLQALQRLRRSGSAARRM